MSAQDGDVEFGSTILVCMTQSQWRARFGNIVRDQNAFGLFALAMNECALRLSDKSTVITFPTERRLPSRNLVIERKNPVKKSCNPAIEDKIAVKKSLSTCLNRSFGVTLSLYFGP